MYKHLDSFNITVRLILPVEKERVFLLHLRSFHHLSPFTCVPASTAASNPHHRPPWWLRDRLVVSQMPHFSSQSPAWVQFRNHLKLSPEVHQSKNNRHWWFKHHHKPHTRTQTQNAWQKHMTSLRFGSRAPFRSNSRTWTATSLRMESTGDLRKIRGPVGA